MRYLYGKFNNADGKAEPKIIIFYGVTTTCIFGDNTKITARPMKDEKFDKQTGVAMCIAKYICGSRANFLRVVKKGCEL